MDLKRFDKSDYKMLNGGGVDSEINGNHIILCFSDFDFDPDIISHRLGLEPLYKRFKGEQYFIGTKNVLSRISDCNYWGYEWKSVSNDFIGDFIDEFFNKIIIPKLPLIQEISKKCGYICLNIVQYYYTGYNPGYAFNNKQIKLLAEINADIDIDVYCLCEDE